MNLDVIRKDFPVLESCTYLDSAALSPLPMPVVHAIARKLEDRSRRGVRGFWDWLKVADATRAKLAQLIGASADEIAFTQNTSEGINLVASMLDWRPGDNAVIADLEFHPNVYPWLRLKSKGVETRIARHSAGDIGVEKIKALCDARTRVIALSHVAWVNGLVHPVDELGAFCRARGIYLCLDAIQSVGAMPVDVREGVDFLSCGGHKWLLAPLGTGFFYCRKELIARFDPPVVGWQSDDRPLDSQDYGFRDAFSPGPTARRFNHGNSNMAGIVGMGAALDYVAAIGRPAVEARNRALADRVIEGAKRLGFAVQSPQEPHRRSHIVNIVPPDLDAAVAALKDANVQVSMRLKGLRVSPAFYNTEDEVDRLLDVLDRAAKRRTGVAAQ